MRAIEKAFQNNHYKHPEILSFIQTQQEIEDVLKVETNDYDNRK